jgi:hypothetical protein
MGEDGLHRYFPAGRWHGEIMDYVFRKSLVAGGTSGFIRLQREVGGEAGDVYLADPALMASGALTLEQLARRHFHISPGDTVTFIDDV